MKLAEQKNERRKFKRRRCHIKPIAVLGPDPIRVGHIISISDDAVEIQFVERNGIKSDLYNELSVLIPDQISPFLSGKIQVETISCSKIENSAERFQSPMRKCVISLNNLNLIQKRQLKGACL